MSDRSDLIGTRVLIANRGEIALRIIRACRELGMSPVAIYGPGEESVRHVLAADDAYRLPPGDTLPSTVTPGQSMRVLFHGDVVRRRRDEYRRVWDELRMDNLNTELADQLHILSGINQDKYAALDKLYTGVTIMTGLLTVTLVTIAGYHLTR